MGTFTRLLRGMDTKKMRRVARETAREAGKPYPLVFCDMVWCGFRYQAGYSDYALFHMWDMNGKERSTVLTRGINNRYVAALNKREGWHAFEQKTDFLRRFSPFIRRRWLDLEEADAQALKEMGTALGAFLVKPRDGTHGDGIRRIDAAGVTDWEKLYADLKAEGVSLCEEVIPQHPVLNELWPGSINTVRLATIVNGGKAHVVEAYLRVGNGPRPVDNFNSGGMVVPLDKETGVILAPALDKAGNLYPVHPATGVRFQGLQIPMWEEILDFVSRAALVEPRVRYVAWDVAVTPVGPDMVEGNHFPGHDICGLPAHTPDKIGVLPDFEAVIPVKELSKLK